MDYVLTAGKKTRDLKDVVKYCVGVEIPKENITSAASYLIDCYKKLYSELFDNKLLHIYQDIDMPICYILNDMEQEGVKIDQQYLRKLSSDFAVKIAELEKKIYALTEEEFNIASPKQLGEILFGKMKLPFAKTTGKTKSFSTSADILDKLHEEGFEIAALLLEWRH